MSRKGTTKRYPGEDKRRTPGMDRAYTPGHGDKWGIWAVRYEGSIFGYGANWHTKGGEREEFDTEDEARAKATEMNQATGTALVSYRAMPIGR